MTSYCERLFENLFEIPSRKDLIPYLIEKYSTTTTFEDFIREIRQKCLDSELRDFTLDMLLSYHGNLDQNVNTMRTRGIRICFMMHVMMVFDIHTLNIITGLNHLSHSLDKRTIKRMENCIKSEANRIQLQSIWEELDHITNRGSSNLTKEIHSAAPRSPTYEGVLKIMNTPPIKTKRTNKMIHVDESVNEDIQLPIGYAALRSAKPSILSREKKEEETRAVTSKTEPKVQFCLRPDQGNVASVNSTSSTEYNTLTTFSEMINVTIVIIFALHSIYDEDQKIALPSRLRNKKARSIFTHEFNSTTTIREVLGEFFEEMKTRLGGDVSPELSYSSGKPDNKVTVMPRNMMNYMIGTLAEDREKFTIFVNGTKKEAND